MTSYCKLDVAMRSYPEACPTMRRSDITATVTMEAFPTCLANILTTFGCRDMSDTCAFDARCISCYEPDSICFACERGYFLVQGYCVQLYTDYTDENDIPTSRYVFFTRNFAAFESHSFKFSASWFAGTSEKAPYNIGDEEWGDFEYWSPFPNHVLGEVNRLITSDYVSWL